MGEHADNLYGKLISYADSDYYGFHMPGHKRNKAVTGTKLPYEIDITEIEGFDDLHHAKGILKQAQERAAKVFGGEETCFLINGSTVGILSAVLGCTQRGDKILIARNCHKSVYHAVYLNALKAEYVYPQFYKGKELNGEIKPEDVQRILEQNENSVGKSTIRAVVITSPTYDGVVSDIERIAKIVHSYGIPLIVDEAHGAHFGFHPYFPENANRNKADVVIHSIHKTLPSLTQTALLHMNGTTADRERIKNYLHMLQSSSPSYVLMAGIDTCIELLDSRKKDILFENYTALLKRAREELKKMQHLQLIETENFDFSKMIISVEGTGYTGRQLYIKLLEKYHLQMEMAAGSYVLAMTSIGDTKEGFDRIVRALQEMDREINQEKSIFGQIWDEDGRNPDQMTEKGIGSFGRIYSSGEEQPDSGGFFKPEQVFTCAEAERIGKSDRSNVRVLPWNRCPGMVSMEYAYLYPPGIPLIVPGERISKEVILLIQEYKKMGFQIEGLKENGSIRAMDVEETL